MSTINPNIPGVQVVGIPFAGGQPAGGVAHGPVALREAGLLEAIRSLGYTVQDQGDLTGVEESPTKEAADPLKLPCVPSNLQNTGSFLGKVYRKCRSLLENGEFLLNLGGDHSIAVSTVAASLEKYPDLCVIWVDAHADCNTPTTSPSGHYHGMPLAHILGWFSSPAFPWVQVKLPEERLALIGLRDIDPEEGQLLRASNVSAFSMSDVDGQGIGSIVTEALKRIDPEGTRKIHLSLDIDGVDPVFAPGTGTLSRGGLSLRESHYICEALAKTGRLVSMDLVEVNTQLDTPENRVFHGDSRIIQTNLPTVRLACELVLSALGKTIF